MPSDHISNTDYHEWVEGKDQGEKGAAGVCAKCGAEIRWPKGMQTKSLEGHLEGGRRFCYECWLGDNPPPLAD